MREDVEGLFPLATLFGDEAMPICWSFGLGVDSAAGVTRTLLDPGFRPPQLLDDLSNLTVMVAQTGDEWRVTNDLVAQHILPLLAARRVRFVEVARAGPSVADGIVVLQDTRTPTRLHPDPDEHGFYPLSAEHRGNGVMPTLAGRACSAKAKGQPLDAWRATHLGPRPYIHAIGYSAEESGRIARDTSVTMGGRRHPIYPLYEAGMTRAMSQGYLYGLFGVWWPKSCCRQCGYISVPSWPDQLARYRTFPEEAFKHLVDEYCALALNHRSGLFGPGKSLRDRLRADGACEVHALADAAMDVCEWAVYRVRRCYSARAQAWRAVEIIHRADRAEAERFIGNLADSLQIAVRVDGEHTRLWLTVETEDYPRLEEFFVAAPNTINPKKRSGFETRWGGHADERLLALEHAALHYADSPVAA
ncbi:MULTISPECIES: hypothetical protein [Nocardia]|uniref:hypothetical protein n=1 Tax=Nocardia TaxID=1817 RepID=UPI0002F5C537|nr:MULTISPECIES: hypothetical protein [Nocardia]